MPVNRVGKELLGQPKNLNLKAQEALSLLGRNIRRACVDGNDREVRQYDDCGMIVRH